MRPLDPAVKNAPPGNSRHRESPTERDATCRRFAATQALKRLSGLWKSPILLLLMAAPQRFAELEKSLGPISAKVLTQRLKEMERDGLIERRELVSTAPKVVEYRLAPLGDLLRPAFAALADWEAAVLAGAHDTRLAPAVDRIGRLG
jgi:DNA-binding HxlR family transcriptional regulator